MVFTQQRIRLAMHQVQQQMTGNAGHDDHARARALQSLRLVLEGTGCYTQLTTLAKDVLADCTQV